VKTYNFDIIQHDGHMIQACGPSTGHSIRTVAMCEGAEIANYLLTTVSAYDKHRDLIETLTKALGALALDVRDYPAWQRPCHALDTADAALAAAKTEGF